MKTKKITKSTIKSFCNKNKDNLYVLRSSSFDGMTDCVQPAELFSKIESINWENSNAPFNNGSHIGWFVGQSRDYFIKTATGFEVSNCCGSFRILTK